MRLLQPQIPRKFFKSMRCGRGRGWGLRVFWRRCLRWGWCLCRRWCLLFQAKLDDWLRPVVDNARLNDLPIHDYSTVYSLLYSYVSIYVLTLNRKIDLLEYH